MNISLSEIAERLTDVNVKVCAAGGLNKMIHDSEVQKDFEGGHSLDGYTTGCAFTAIEATVSDVTHELEFIINKLKEAE